MATIEQILATLPKEQRTALEQKLNRLSQWDQWGSQNQEVLSRWGEVGPEMQRRLQEDRDPDFSALTRDETPDWETVQRGSRSMARRLQAIEAAAPHIVNGLRTLQNNSQSVSQLAVEMAEIARSKPHLSPKRVAELAIKNQSKDWAEAVSAAEEEHESQRNQEREQRANESRETRLGREMGEPQMSTWHRPGRAAQPEQRSSCVAGNLPTREIKDTVLAHSMDYAAKNAS